MEATTKPSKLMVPGAGGCGGCGGAEGVCSVMTSAEASRCEVRSPHAACGVSCTVLTAVNHHALLPTPMVYSLPRYREVLAVNAQVEADAASARDTARAAQAHEKAAVGERDEALARAAQAEAALAALRAAHEAQASQLVRSVAASHGR